MMQMFPIIAAAARRRAAAASPYVFSDDCEYADTEAAIASNKWVVTGAPTFGYASAPAPLAGTRSLSIGGFGGDYVATPSFPGNEDTWVYFIFSKSSLAATQTMLAFTDAIGTVIASATVVTDGKIKVKATTSGTDNTSAGSVMTAGLVYHVWLHYRYTAGVGQLDAYVSSSSTRSALIVTTTRTSSGGVARAIQIGPTSSGIRMIWDKIRVSHAEIGDDPL